MRVFHKNSSTGLAAAAAQLRAKGLVAFPTETVYGLGALAREADAVTRIFAFKRRPPTDPIIVHVANPEMGRDLLEEASKGQGNAAALPQSCTASLGQIHERFERLAEKLWPGPLSLLVPRPASIPSIVTAGGDKMALRCPRHNLACKLIELVACPIAAPSANPFGYLSPSTAAHVEAMFANHPGAKDLIILDGGPCEAGIESTVLDICDEEVGILRPGAISQDEIEHWLGYRISQRGSRSLADKARSSNVQYDSPGLLSSHYAPHTPLQVFPRGQFWNSIGPYSSKIAYLAFSRNEASSPLWEKYPNVYFLSELGHPVEAAASLYAMLHHIDSMKEYEHIMAELCGRLGLGEAIDDRLLRASSSSKANL